jgi:YD repeat-containing protein
MTETNALGHERTTEYDPTRGVTTAMIDANGKRTDATYDGLGRTLQVWNPGWTKTDHPSQPSTEFSLFFIFRSRTTTRTTSLTWSFTGREGGLGV